MKHKIAIGTGGSSGTINAKALLGRLVQVQDLPKFVGIVMSDNAKFSWKSELGDNFYENYSSAYGDNRDFMLYISSGL